MRKFFSLAAILYLYPMAEANSDQCFGGATDSFVVVELSNTNYEFCSRICFADTYWQTDAAHRTLARFVIAADNAGTDKIDIYGTSLDRNEKRIWDQLEDGVRLEVRTTIQQAVVHAFMCTHGVFSTYCGGQSSLICD